MNIKLSKDNRPTKPGLYIMKEHSYSTPMIVEAGFIHIGGDEFPTKDLTLRCLGFDKALNEHKADGSGKWNNFINLEAKFSEPLSFQ